MNIERKDKVLSASQASLAAEVAALKLLQNVSTELIAEQEPKAIGKRLVEVAMRLMRSDAASIQIVDRETGQLTLLASRNFHPDSEKFWQFVDANSSSTCGKALHENRRIVVSDIDTSDFMRGSDDLTEYRRSGLRSVQSTVLTNYRREPIGMISTHWREVHEPLTPSGLHCLIAIPFTERFGRQANGGREVVSGKSLKGKSILLVEDEYFIVDDMVRAFKKRGASIVGPVATVAAALKVVDGGERIDAAVLDINLQGKDVFPVADALADRGVCFIFATGYDKIAIPEKYDAIVRCEKPVHPDQVFDALSKACA